MKKKSIKAWAVVTKRGQMEGTSRGDPLLFTHRDDAEDFRYENDMPDSPLTVVPVTITYEVPNKE